MWLQQAVKRKQIGILKIKGTENPSDLMTKFVDSATLDKLSNIMGLMVREGRAAAAPEVTSNVSTEIATEGVHAIDDLEHGSNGSSTSSSTSCSTTISSNARSSPDDGTSARSPRNKQMRSDSHDGERNGDRFGWSVFVLRRLVLGVLGRCGVFANPLAVAGETSRRPLLCGLFHGLFQRRRHLGGCTRGVDHCRLSAYRHGLVRRLRFLI